MPGGRRRRKDRGQEGRVVSTFSEDICWKGWPDRDAPSRYERDFLFLENTWVSSSISQPFLCPPFYSALCLICKQRAWRRQGDKEKERGIEGGSTVLRGSLASLVWKHVLLFRIRRDTVAGAESYFCSIYTTDCSPVRSSVWSYGSYVLCFVRVRDNRWINRIAWNTLVVFVFPFESISGHFVSLIIVIHGHWDIMSWRCRLNIYRQSNTTNTNPACLLPISTLTQVTEISIWEESIFFESFSFRETVRRLL